MKRYFRTCAMLFMLLVLVAAISPAAYAATKTQNDLKLELTTDKESYAVGETVQCILNAVNGNDQELTITYDVILPDGLQLAGGERGVLVVGAGEEIASQFALQAVARGADQVPNTGDGFPVELLAALCVVAFALAGILLARKKRLMMFMLVFVLLFGMAEPALVSVASAEDGYYPAAEEKAVYAEDAFQEVFEEVRTEEEMEALWDEAELKALAQEQDEEILMGSDVLDQFTLEQNVFLNNQIVTIRVNATVTAGGDSLSGMKATLATPTLQPITILGKTKFRLKWSEVPGATHYEVWHLLNGTYVKKTTTNLLRFTTSYGNPGVVNTYKVRAIQVSDGVTVAKSAYATRTCYGMATPTLTSVEYVSDTSNHVRISWKAASFCTGYNVYRSYSGTPGTYQWIGKSTGLSFVDKYHNAYYKIRPYYISKSGINYSGPASALLSMENPFDIITQPESVTVVSGQTAKVTLEAMGKDLVYQWYYADAGKTSFSKSKIVTNTYSCKMTSSLNGRRLYCVVTDANGRRRTTKTVTLNIQDFTYTLENGNCTITGYIGNAAEVTVPATIENCPVVAIASQAFMGETGITGITLPDSVTSIGEYAFSGCTSLTSITIPSGVTIIEDYTFNECTKLASVTLPNTITQIGKRAFYSCTSLSSMDTY